MSFERHIEHYAFKEEWLERKMVFLTGPRQVGKTFSAKLFLKKYSSLKLYYNWDLPDIAQRYRQDPYFFESEARLSGLKRPTLVFDEIHKRSHWRQELKAFYDRFHEEFNLIVTGSARLDLLRRTGESLAGRYFLFRVFPLSLQELVGKLNHKISFSSFEECLAKLAGQRDYFSNLEQLQMLGGYPDPLSVGKLDYRRKWEQDYRRFLLKEDLRDLSRIQELDRVETLWTLLPGKVGSPLSIASLQQDLQASHEAVRTWLLNLEKIYVIFFLLPYSKQITRSIKKEKKMYLMDWALHTDESKQFENFVIASLWRAMAIGNDSGEGHFDIRYVRNVQKQEADFLLLKNEKPWLLGDIKLSDTQVDRHLYGMAAQLGHIPIIQIVRQRGVFKKGSEKTLVISADRFLALLP